MTNDAAQRQQRQQEADVNRVMGTLPRTLAHTIRDALRQAWIAGYEFKERT